MTVNLERVRLLVDALRSGKFRRTEGTLVAYDTKSKKYKYCCLGVACEVAFANGLKLQRRRKNHLFGAYDGSSSLLPHTVRDWFGFDDTDPLLTLLPEDYARALNSDVRAERLYHCSFERPATAANDMLTLPFSVIANAFERTYLNDNDTEQGQNS